MVEIGRYRHRVAIYDRTQTQNADGDLADVAVSLGSRWAEIETKRVGGEQADGAGLTSFLQSTLRMRHDRGLMAKLTGTTYFVVSTMDDAVFEADGPPVDQKGTFREILVPVTQSVPEDLPSE